MALIMVIDDDETVRALVSTVLMSDGYEIVAQPNAKVALDLIGVTPGIPQTVKPDLIVMDVMMPEMDGFTAHNLLRDNPLTKRIPLIILTSKGGMKEGFAQSGNVASFMEKPFKPAELRAEVLRLLQARGKA